MARMPGTTWVGEHGSREMDRYDIVCLHTIVGWAPAHAAHFSVKADGTILQSRDTRFRSAANLDGNHRVIAIEVEDHGPDFGGVPTDTRTWPAMTDAQVASCARITAWAHEEHDVPLQLCPDSRPGSRGLAYHRQGIDGNFGEGTAYPALGRVAGGEVWTSSRGKVCPGDARINQRPAVLAQAIDLTTDQEDDMFTDADRATLNQIQQGQKTMRENVRKRDVALRGLVVDALESLRQDKRADRVVIGKLTAIEAALAEDVDGA